MINTTKKYIRSVDELSSHIKTHKATLYISSATSTVIPFEAIQNQNLKSELVDLSGMKGEISLTKNGELKIRGHITWKEAKEFARANGREVLTSPTEELAGVLAGVATSCTGERSFGFSNLRSQIVELKYLDFNGNEKSLDATKTIDQTLSPHLKKYTEAYLPYRNFKNAPFPRFETETDLMTGTEGQLGVITEAILKTRKLQNETYLFFKLPKWTEDYKSHLEIFRAIQGFRSKVFACEFIDFESLSYVPASENPASGSDLIFLEIEKDELENFLEDFLPMIPSIDPENIFEMEASKCRALRVLVPRSIFEANSRMGVTKKGTDVQVSPEKFEALLLKYRQMHKLENVKSNLFGHFGDAHLHFNFMPTPQDEAKCVSELQKLYDDVLKWHGSPFAEHGIGLLKRKFIAPFYSETQRQVFADLKKAMDPHNQFFPEGFMS